ncbi:MAG: NADH-quinone oxidoreductase subunit J, partial [Rickettsiaceae bacterium]|nr:NADH-quinone oxidoreductase subunit J [Rickettsiaceae bacterium]
AVEVLFLFVIMMLNIKFTEFKSAIGAEMSFAATIMLLLFADLAVIILLGTKVITLPGNNEFSILPEISNAHAIGNLLYTTFILPFQTAGLVLFVAMVASISLTLRLRPGVKRQNVAQQMRRNKENSLRLEKVKLKSGISDLNYDD